MKTVTCRIDLGYTRIAGYTLFDQETMEFQETTPKDVMNLMRADKINGLAFNEKGEIIPDMEGWNIGNLMIKSSVGNYRHFNSEMAKGNTIYSVVRAIDIDGVGRFYEVINNRCSRIIFKESQLVVLSQLAWVGGIKVNQETEEIELCEGVKVENHSSNNLFEIGNKIYVIQETAQTKADTLEELFSDNNQLREFDEDEQEFDEDKIDQGNNNKTDNALVAEEDTEKVIIKRNSKSSRKKK